MRWKKKLIIFFLVITFLFSFLFFSSKDYSLSSDSFSSSRLVVNPSLARIEETIVNQSGSNTTDLLITFNQINILVEEHNKIVHDTETAIYKVIISTTSNPRKRVYNLTELLIKGNSSLLRGVEIYDQNIISNNSTIFLTYNKTFIVDLTSGSTYKYLLVNGTYGKNNTFDLVLSLANTNYTVQGLNFYPKSNNKIDTIKISNYYLDNTTSRNMINNDSLRILEVGKTYYKYENGMWLFSKDYTYSNNYSGRFSNSIVHAYDDFYTEFKTKNMSKEVIS